MADLDVEEVLALAGPVAGLCVIVGAVVGEAMLQQAIQTAAGLPAVLLQPGLGGSAVLSVEAVARDQTADTTHGSRGIWRREQVGGGW